MGNRRWKFMNNLRNELEKILEPSNSVFSQEDLEKHLNIINNLKEKFSHSIQLHEKLSLDKASRSMCFMYALNLPNNICRYPLNEKIISELIKKNILKPDSKGKIVIYFYDGSPKHAGKREKDFIISKWGGGHIWEHSLWEIPIRYGEYCDFFKMPEETEIKIFLDSYFLDNLCPCLNGQKYKECHGK